MSALILQYFLVSMENPTHNVVAQAKVLAETDVDAIELAKAELKSSLGGFINDFSKARSQRTHKTLAADFWEHTKIIAAVANEAKVLKLDFDRLNKDGGLGSAVK